MSKVYQRIASLLCAIRNCEEFGNVEWKEKHSDNLHSIIKQHMPSGSGFDSGTDMDMNRNTPERLVFRADFHHMDENGYYDGWSEHQVIVTASLQHDFSIRITGRNRRDIKEYIHSVFSDCLNQECKE